MESSKKVPLYSRGGSFLNTSPSNRFKSYNASKSTATKRTNAKLKEESKDEQGQAPRSSLSLNVFRKKSSTSFQDEFRTNRGAYKISMQSKIVYILIFSCFFFYLIVVDKNKTNELKDEMGNPSQVKTNDQLATIENYMKDFTATSTNVDKLPYNMNLRQTNPRYTKMYTGSRLRKIFNPMERREESSQLDQVNNELMKALHSNDQKNVHLTITVGDDDDQKKPKRPSGLQHSPGIPKAGQNLEMLLRRRGRKIYKPSKKMLNKIKTYPHQISDLNCVLYNGPEYNVAQEVVYWEDIPMDSSHEGPFYYVHDNNNYLEGTDGRDSLSKYLTFQPDTGGFNNQRMAFETALVLSVAMGRTLVLPPRQAFPLMTAGSHEEQMLSFEDIYHLDSLTNEFESVNIITMKEFLIREGLQIQHNKTNWDGAGNMNVLWEYLERKAFVPHTWNRNECVAAFPSNPDDYGNRELAKMLDNILDGSDGRQFPHHLDFQGKPLSAHVPAIERLREMMAGRSKICLYNQKMQNLPIIHLPTKPPNQRLLTHFYSFVYFEDSDQSNWVKRLVRDHLRYNDEIMCAAARVIEGMRQSCYSRLNPNGIFYSAHVRKKNFKIPHMNFHGFDYNITSAEVLLSLSEVNEGSCLFIATDDFDENFYQPIREKFKVFHLEDFKDLLFGLNPNFHGMIEQIVVARGRQFHGSFYSTFSGYVNRLRGYYSIREGHPRSTEGVLEDSFYMPSKFKNENMIYKAVQKPFFAREFPAAWRDIGYQ